MNKIILLLFSFVFSLCNAQTALFSEAIAPYLPSALSIIEDNLYVATFGEARVYKIALSNPENATLVSDFSLATSDGCWKMDYYMNQNSIYARSIFNDFLLKVNLNQSLPITAEQIVEIPGFREGIIINQTTGVAYLTGGNLIGTIELNNASPVFSNYYTDPNNDLFFSNPQILNSNLYFIQYGSNNSFSIFKIPLDSSNPEKVLVSDVTGFFGRVQSTLIVQNYLYIGVEDTSTSYILKLNLSNSIPSEPQIAITNYPGGPLGLAYKDGLFYGSESNGSTIVNFTDPTLNIQETTILKTKIYPNPASEQLFLEQAHENISFEIFSQLGQRIMNGIYSEEGIDVSQLTEGVYFLNLQGEGQNETSKFIKN